MRLLNLFYASVMIVSSSLAGLVNRNSNVDNDQSSFTIDVSNFKGTIPAPNIAELAAGAPIIYPGKTISFITGFSKGFEEFNLPEDTDPTNFTKVNRTDDAAVKLAFKKWGVIQDNLVKISSFDPFSVVNFKNMNKYDSMGYADNIERLNQEGKKQSAGISQQSIMKSWSIKDNKKVLALTIKFIVYTSLYWIKTEDSSFLGLTMLVEVDFTPSFPFLVSEIFTFDINMTLGSILKFS